MIEYGVSADQIDYLFASAAANSQAKLDSLAATVLGQGIDYFQNEKYEQAANSFRRAAALSPLSDNAASAYNYMAQSYLKLGNTQQAIKTYKEAFKMFPADETFHRALGDIYLQEEMNAEAIEQYEEAVRLNSNDAEAAYSLGQAYMTAGELDKARTQFQEVARISPNSATGYYGLGQVARAQGDMEDAVFQLTRAIQQNSDFELAYLELGYTYADMGEYIKAEDISAVMDAKESDKVATLDAYILLAREPRILTVTANNGFNTASGPNSRVSSLDGANSTLDRANGKKLFSMNFAFSKDMDEASVTNPYNWSISRATIRDNGGVYNYGLQPSSKEALILPKPAYVTYDSEKNTATVYFWISQNATIDATIDPKHIVFKFNGVDAYGKAMDTTADEYSGFSSIA